MKKKLFIILALAGFSSCTDLDEEVYDTIISDNFYQTERQALAAAGPVYSNLRAYQNPESVWGLNTFTTDEIVLPTRGNNWYNGGMFQRYHKQEWNASEANINNSWVFVFNNINTCNRLLFQFEKIENKSDALLAVMKEIRGMRAFYYFLGMDLFGNVPIVDRFDVPADYAPANQSREEVFRFIESELLAVIPELPVAMDMTTYGRFHRWAAYATLAKLYLNAEVYTGQPMWDECIEACDAIINAGEFQLSSDFYSNFAVQNEGSQENIFVIPFDVNLPQDWGSGGITSRMFSHYLWTLHGDGTRAFNTQQGGWNGFAAVPSFYTSYDPEDARRNVWLVGQQYSSSGEMLYNTAEMAGIPLVYTVEINSLEQAKENEGARLAKYDYTGAENFTMSNDFVLFRYADILLMKAEALMRKNGGATPEAVELVNMVRSRAFQGNEEKAYTMGTLTLDALLAERGWEFAGEGWRRNDLVRFGEYTEPWDFKPNSTPATRTIFPIPQAQLNANPNLVQNPGY
ncbi:RagB/SusD family nutrient uptake outer membrane protein [Pontibacter diazotrophicus]|uniref:RagB/SusD family nutrient uptake outer membrane protein n=1 Tax=Pontibacter diazotrophicus TaxID=1400979 RepID=A0A3D8LII8_9BACT|nr:RagB/SusD family nutrient uptake outer membrane protein [Pontibacter diazotrophicus]RDV17225.1 RagB/SusD family nutrient uptake outer membrane protein [Pontibacter diazotrophicus]